MQTIHIYLHCLQCPGFGAAVPPLTHHVGAGGIVPSESLPCRCGPTAAWNEPVLDPGTHPCRRLSSSAETAVAPLLVVILLAHHGLHPLLLRAASLQRSQNPIRWHAQEPAVREAKQPRKPKSTTEPRSRAKRVATSNGHAGRRPGHTRRRFVAEDAASAGDEEQDGDDGLVDEPPVAKRQRTTQAASLPKRPGDDRAWIPCCPESCCYVPCCTGHVCIKPSCRGSRLHFDAGIIAVEQHRYLHAVRHRSAYSQCSGRHLQSG